MKFSIKDFFGKCDRISCFLRISSHLLKKSLMGNFISCAVDCCSCYIDAWLTLLHFHFPFISIFEIDYCNCYRYVDNGPIYLRLSFSFQTIYWSWILHRAVDTQGQGRVPLHFLEQFFFPRKTGIDNRERLGNKSDKKEIGRRVCSQKSDRVQENLSVYFFL